MRQKKPLDEAHIHEGHRKRLLETVLNAGMENVSDIQAMEFILCYVFPRGDVNPLAHRLLHEFGSVANVLDSDVNSLKAVEGIGDRSAKSLYLLGRLFDYYTDIRSAEKVTLSNYEEICDYFEELLRFRNQENFVIVGLDSKFKLIQKKILARGSVVNVGIKPIEVSNFVASTNPVYILFAHNHPKGSAVPSQNDLESNKELDSLLRCLGVKFVDHIVVAEDGVFSIKKNNFLRRFN